jgi:hypothetical protein
MRFRGQTVWKGAHYRVTKWTASDSGLEPQPTIDNKLLREFIFEVPRPDGRGGFGRHTDWYLQKLRWYVDYVASLDKVTAVAFHQPFAVLGRTRKDVEWMTDSGPGKDVSIGPAGIRRCRQVLGIFDPPLLCFGKVKVALTLGEAWEAGSGVDEVREDVIYDLYRQVLKARREIREDLVYELYRQCVQEVMRGRHSTCGMTCGMSIHRPCRRHAHNEKQKCEARR